MSPGILNTILCYFSYLVIMTFGSIREIVGNGSKTHQDKRPGYGCMLTFMERLCLLHLIRPIVDNFMVPIGSKAGTKVTVLERETFDVGYNFTLTGKSREMINMGSYNYLDLNQNEGHIADQVEAVIHEKGIAVGSSRQELGTNDLCEELDRLIAEFLCVESAITFGMGFETNATTLAALLDAKTIAISDEFNHSSIVHGCKISGAKIKVYKHNDMQHLEEKLLEAMIEVDNFPECCTKIVILTEGVYSMEGSITKLAEIIALKEKYKAYIYLDEAHSIGALGSHGRGVTDLLACDISKVDVLMGTFTKSFGASGGYIAGSKELIDHLKKSCFANYYACSLAPPICGQIMAAMRTLMSDDGCKLVQSLASNTIYFRNELRNSGFDILGCFESPVVPLMVYFPSKMAFFGRALRERGIAAAVVGFPATKPTESRVRFCVSAGHTRKELDAVLSAVNRVAKMAWL